MTYEKINGKVMVTIGNETKPIAQWARENNISEKTLAGRIYSGWDEENIFNKPGLWKPQAKFNEYYFDTIDDEHKAYWLGFIWCDGYMSIRNRTNRRNTSYEFKLSLKEDDYGHLEKFNNDLNGNYDVHFYNTKGFNRKETCIEARLLITNQHFGQTLVNKYGLVPNRVDCSKIIQEVPQHLMKHFIRGMIDADGSICQYDHINIRNGREHLTNKMTISIGGHFDLIKHIERNLIDNNLIAEFDRKVNKRHEEDGRDGEYRSLQLSGKTQGLKVLHYMYDDATIYLDRKYEKFLEIIAKLEGTV
nr:MAG TPA: Intron-encoded DNA endonuclease I-AniI [Caudoviricetes sp.]